MSGRRLNLGSGADYRAPADGWVNLDAFRDSHHHVGETRLDVQADAHVLPFPDETFEHVHFSHTMEHLERPLDALHEVFRVLVPGGTVYTEVPDPDRINGEREEHFYSWTEWTLHHIHQAAGFEIDSYAVNKPTPQTLGHHVKATKPA